MQTKSLKVIRTRNISPQAFIAPSRKKNKVVTHGCFLPRKRRYELRLSRLCGSFKAEMQLENGRMFYNGRFPTWSVSEMESSTTVLDLKHSQGRINLYANYAMAWGPAPRGPRGGRRYFSHQYQFGDCNYVCTLLSFHEKAIYLYRPHGRSLQRSPRPIAAFKGFYF